jgi:hypothetical protein
MNRTHSSGLAVAIGLVVFVATSVSGQAQRPSATMDDLLAEVCGLRADLTQMAGVSGRMQVSLVRLSLQEQRAGTTTGAGPARSCKGDTGAARHRSWTRSNRGIDSSRHNPH